LRLEEVLHGVGIIKKPVVDKSLLNLVGEERSHCIFKELRILEFQEEIKLMRTVFGVVLRFLLCRESRPLEHVVNKLLLLIVEAL
jgi:hypothetical protein